MDCLFCKIISGEIPSYKIYEDDIVLAFLDINPESNGHTLIIPKQHFKDLDDINEMTLNYIMSIAKKIKNELYEKLNCDGITLVQNNGDIQEIKHYHLHLKPFYNNQINVSVEDVYNILKKD